MLKFKALMAEKHTFQRKTSVFAHFNTSLCTKIWVVNFVERGNSTILIAMTDAKIRK